MLRRKSMRGSQGWFGVSSEFPIPESYSRAIRHNQSLWQESYYSGANRNYCAECILKFRKSAESWKMEMIYASFINSLSEMQAEPPRARFDWRHKAGSASLQTNVYNYFLGTIFVARLGLLQVIIFIMEPTKFDVSTVTAESAWSPSFWSFFRETGTSQDLRLPPRGAG